VISEMKVNAAVTQIRQLLGNATAAGQ